MIDQRNFEDSYFNPDLSQWRNVLEECAESLGLSPESSYRHCQNFGPHFQNILKLGFWFSTFEEWSNVMLFAEYEVHSS
jgi:hypothetical protein